MGPALRERRHALLRSDLKGKAWCAAYAHEADEWLIELADSLAPRGPRGLAILAVGGYGRGELAPHSDLDLVVVHARTRRVDDFVRQLSYPIYDQGVALDLAARTVKASLDYARHDLRVALGLLDGRMLWGDQHLADELLASVRALWARELGEAWLPELERQMSERHLQHGDVSDLLEPDLKEAHGGLRDINVVRAVHLAFPAMAGADDLAALAAADEVLTEARVALHAHAGRDANRLLLQEQDGVAAAVGCVDADVLMQRVSRAGRIVARLSDHTWRRRAVWSAGAGESDVALEGSYRLIGGELHWNGDNPTALDVMSVAAQAATLDLPLADETLRVLATAPVPDAPWSEELRAAFIRLLAGSGLVAAVESLEDRELFRRLLPEWEAVHSYHQRNAYHRFTVDRHLLEAVRFAQSELDQVARPDLLLLGCLFHDIGKGRPGDHTEVGIELVRGIGPRLGLPDADTEVLVTMVRHHLLLADSATRRDLDDPATARFVAAAVGDDGTLDLLAALSRADGTATGPSAWSSFKARLVDSLVLRTKAVLEGGEVASAATVTDELLEHARGGGVHARREAEWITIASLDRPGLLAVITAALALHGLDVRSADLHAEEGVALDRFYCEPGARGWPEPADLARTIEAGLAGRRDLLEELRARVAAYPVRRQSAGELSVHVAAIRGASERATVVELRAPDRRGLLSTVAAVVAEAQVDVTAARLSTVGDVAIDTFYLRTPSGEMLDPSTLDVLVAALHNALTVFSGLDH